MGVLLTLSTTAAFPQVVSRRLTYFGVTVPNFSASQGVSQSGFVSCLEVAEALLRRLACDTQNHPDRAPAFAVGTCFGHRAADDLRRAVASAASRTCRR